MAISNFEENGKQYFRVYVQAVGKENKSLRVQRTKTKIESLSEAQRIEKIFIKTVTEEIGKLEGRGLTWGDILDRWEIAARMGHLGDRYKDPILIRTHVDRLRKHTALWMKRIASELTKGDGRFILNQAKNNGASTGSMKNIKSSVNVVFKWAVEEKFVRGVQTSPTEGLLVAREIEKVPKILSMEEIRKLLSAAKSENHPWYPIWAFAFLTGMRSGELKALQFKDIDFEKGVIVVSKSMCAHTKKLKCTKAGYWRNVPISRELNQVIEDLKSHGISNPDDFVLPRLNPWLSGDGSFMLRAYLQRLGVQSNVVFHTLRACFATHMLALGVDQATVMKIGGWKDIKTFQIYIRLAGIEVKGATDVLSVLPLVNQAIPPQNVVQLVDYNRSLK